jgi:hypothetical protein
VALGDVIIGDGKDGEGHIVEFGSAEFKKWVELWIDKETRGIVEVMKLIIFARVGNCWIVRGRIIGRLGL